VAVAVMPLKDLVRAKSRLAGLLSPSERRALAQAMAEDVLAVLAGHPEVERTVLVSDDPGAGLLAQKYGADCRSEDALGGGDINSLLYLACAGVAGTGASLVLHADLPLLSGGDLDAVFACQRRTGGLVIGCDRHGTGTNLLAFPARRIPQFHFGPGSCARHRDSGRDAGLHVDVMRRQGSACDVDDAADLAQVMAMLPGAGQYSRALLADTELGRRLNLALSSLGGPAGEDKGAVNHHGGGGLA